MNQEQLTYQDEINALIDLAKEIWRKWNGENNAGGIVTPVGSLNMQTFNIRIAKPNAYSGDWRECFSLEYWNHMWVIEKGSFQSLETARERLIAMSQYLASEDFQVKRCDSISTMKRVAKAIRG